MLGFFSASIIVFFLITISSAVTALNKFSAKLNQANFYFKNFIFMVLILSLSSSSKASSLNSTSTQTLIETETGLRMLYIEQHNIKNAIEKLETEQAQLKTQMIQFEEEQENAMHQYEAFIREIESYEEEYSKAWKKMLPILSQIKTQQRKKNSQTKISFYQSLTASKDIALLREIEARIEYFTKEKNIIIDTIAEKNEYSILI